MQLYKSRRLLIYEIQQWKVLKKMKRENAMMNQKSEIEEDLVVTELDRKIKKNGMESKQKDQQVFQQMMLQQQQNSNNLMQLFAAQTQKISLINFML